VVVEHLVADADRRAGRGRLGAAALRQPPAPHLMMPGVAVGHRDEQHLVALAGVQGRHAAGREVAGAADEAAAELFVLNDPGV